VLDATRQLGETPGGVLIFRATGAEPGLPQFDVASRPVPQGLGKGVPCAESAAGASL
jgi:hypothetical protein